MTTGHNPRADYPAPPPPSGPPAFPTPLPNIELPPDEAYESLKWHSGMTLRDYFAAKAMQGLVGTVFYTDGNLLDREVAQHAFEMADAMLKARES